MTQREGPPNPGEQHQGPHPHPHHYHQQHRTLQLQQGVDGEDGRLNYHLQNPQMKSLHQAEEERETDKGPLIAVGFRALPDWT